MLLRFHSRSLYNNIKAPSQLQPSATYYLFKVGGSSARCSDDAATSDGMQQRIKSCWSAEIAHRRHDNASL